MLCKTYLQKYKLLDNIYDRNAMHIIISWVLHQKQVARAGRVITSHIIYGK